MIARVETVSLWPEPAFITMSKAPVAAMEVSDFPPP